MIIPTAIVVVEDGEAEAVFVPIGIKVKVIDLDTAQGDEERKAMVGEAYAEIDYQVSQESFWTIKHFDDEVTA